MWRDVGENSRSEEGSRAFNSRTADEYLCALAYCVSDVLFYFLDCAVVNEWSKSPETKLQLSEG